VIGNFDVAPATGSVAFQSGGTWYDYLNNTLLETTGAAQPFTLQPGEFHVYINRNVNNTTATAVPDVPLTETGLQVSAFPNPARTSVVVDVNLPQNGAVQLQFFDLYGRLLKTEQKGYLTKGKHRFVINKTHLPTAAGAYFLQVGTRNATKTTQIILQ
jgi:hypothetical protein